MKKVLSILLIIAFLQPIALKVYIFIDFQVNKAFIAEVLCINKDEPEILCSGKCYLNNQLEKTEDQQKDFPQSLKDKSELTLYFYEKEVLSESESIFRYHKTDFCNEIRVKSNYLNRLLRPPQVFI